ncbi:D-alanyl-D-alanine carboxypeptidase [uncultured Thiocystis sp.]|jgi:D-alanyl-D-alanine carboxypeptidase/D-alanyl-D-alanine-endopeptidase (penicillin-binding protein 4)|uniref:D-alanyl-D-alanine carboxypeptidase/D-alanyl-D-alanine-endopeptidase n=1 Tax=uncultured Thiocystis sp. TaxID=1202134 RepID=UPI0025D3D077|nr:D-alanyl-D-alanine carboxypeptidase [uncultured Thiocystis sp.]
MKSLTHPIVSSQRHWVTSLLILLALSVPPAAATDPLAQVKGMGQASLLLKERGRDLIAYQPDTPRIPASTMKLLTAFAALETWGRDDRFQTDFHQDGTDWLWVKGYADPYLVSEELDRMVAALKSRGLREVAGIGLDDSFFSPDVEIAGRSASDNPYDAPVTALAANFNTLNLVRIGDQVRSAEPQTPLTPTARRFGLAGGAGKQRVNLREREVALRYFGELLAAKLEQAGVRVGNQRKIAPMPRHTKRFYRHANSHTLVETVESMLKFSNNFIANALFLRLADPRGEGVVSMAAARSNMTDFARSRFGWREFSIEDGAGLSRGNRLSARQLVELLEAFAPYRDLLSVQEGNKDVRAKTGTLRGVSCYAGYVRREGAWAPFALLLNQPVEYNLRQRVASSLVR